MDIEDRWETDPFDDGSSKLVGERQIQVMKDFEESHVAVLQRLWQSSLSAIGKSDFTARLKTGHLKDPIGLWFHPYEQSNLLQLVKTDNKLFNKITQTFTSLVHEMELLSEEGSSKFYAPLALFGKAVTDDDRKEAGEMQQASPPQPKVPGDSEDAYEGEAQVWMGRMWPLLISLAQFVHRAYAVVANVMRQLGSLYHPQSRIFIQSYQNVHLTIVYQKLFKLLSVLITLDEIISLNDQLPTCWGMYKRMVKTINKDPSKYQVEKEALWKFEKLMFDIQGLLMDGQIFRNCIEQEFDFVSQGSSGMVLNEAGEPVPSGPAYPPYKVEVKNNVAFAKEFYYHLKQMEDFLLHEAQLAQTTVTGLGGSGFSASAITSGGMGLANSASGSPLVNSILSDESSTGTCGGKTYMGTCILFSLWFSIWRQQDDPCRKLFKMLYEHAKKVPIVHLYGMAVFDGPTILARHAPPLVNLSKLAQPQALTAAIRTQYLQMSVGEIAQKTKILFYTVSRWLVRMESIKPTDILPQDQGAANGSVPNGNAQKAGFSTSMALLAQGLKLASAASLNVKHILCLHTHLAVGLKAQLIPHLFESLHLVKAIQGTFIRHRGWIARLFYQHHSEVVDGLSNTLSFIQQSLLKAKLTEVQLDQLAAATLGLDILQQGPPTTLRLIVLLLSLHQAGINDYYNPQEQKAVQVLVARLAFINRFNRDLRDVCDTSFAYWYSDLLPLYLKYLYQNSVDAHKLPYTIQVMGSDIPNVLLQQCIHESPAAILASYRRQISAALHEHIVHPLCKEIEVDLRLHIHSQTEGAVNQLEPFKQGVHDVLPFLLLPPLQLHTYDLDIKTYVQHYLDTNFYNVNTVALYDWQNYGEMRNLALAKYGLELQPVHLPGQTLEQGVDILMIMRKIQVFTRDYSYNLNNQIFVQKSSEDNKTLNTINIQHVANSIRTHGTGIMNTTINFTYQFLKQKFAVFSQFLFDEQIKATLFREIRFFTENKEKLDSRYPWERADKIARDIKKLGLTPDGLSFLDKFRILITEIGNAMGYVRMIRSGGLLHTSNAIKFVPDIEGVAKFTHLFQPEGAEIPADGSPAENRPANVSQETWDAAKNLDAILEALTHNFAEGTNYFKMFVSVFAPQFHSAANLHLKNFYIIIPALTMSFVESMLVAKEKMNKIKKGSKGATDGQFTDDGFAIGIAYILRLLDQDREFESLHWFQSVLNKLAIDEKEAQAAEAAVKKDDTTSLARLTLKKVTSLHNEYSLLRFSVTGARVFFSETGVDKKNTTE